MLYVRHAHRASGTQHAPHTCPTQADLAVDGNMSRSCPAKDLSIVLSQQFVEALFEAQAQWELPAAEADAISFAGSTPFVSAFAFQPK